MSTCQICAEEKPTEEFAFLPYFTKHKKHKVKWCRDCQGMYMEMRKERLKQKKRVEDESKFTVCFH